MRSIIVRSCLLEYRIQFREETFSNQWQGAYRDDPRPPESFALDSSKGVTHQESRGPLVKAHFDIQP